MPTMEGGGTVGIELDTSGKPIQVIHGGYDAEKKEGVLHFLQLVLLTILGFAFISMQMETPSQTVSTLVKASFAVLLLIIVVSSFALYCLEGATMTTWRIIKGGRMKEFDISRWFYRDISKMMYTMYLAGSALFLVGFIVHIL